MAELSPDRIKIIERINEYELNGWFSKDVEDDPPTIPLLPDMVDYLCEKFSSKIKMKFAKLCKRLINSNLDVWRVVRVVEYVALEKR